MASNPTEPNAKSLEEVQAELARALAELQESVEQNRRMAEEAKITQDTLSSLKRELESVRSSKKHYKKVITSPRHLNFSENEEEEHDLSPTEEEKEENPKRMKLETITALRAQQRQFMKILSNLPGAPVPFDIEEEGGYSRSPFIEEISKASCRKD